MKTFSMSMEQKTNLIHMKLQSIPRSLSSGIVGIIRNTNGQRPFMKERADSRVAGYVIRTRNTM